MGRTKIASFIHFWMLNQVVFAWALQDTEDENNFSHLQEAYCDGKSRSH
jgi:hypothetical protein